MKNFIQRVKSLATFLIFGVFLSAPFSMGAAMKTELSAEDLKMLDEIGKEVERYVNALPTEAQLRAQGVPEEEIKKRETKEKFDAEVKRYSEMSEKQLLEEMEKVFSEAASQVPQQPQPETEKPNYTPTVQPETTKPVEKPIVPSDKQLAALKLIDGVLISINNFMNKAQIMVELPGKIPTWVKEGKLRNWPAGLTWNNFSGQIEELQAKLNKIKDRDPRSGTFKYLDDFIKDESLINNLAKTRDSLTRNEPKIELSSLIDKMTTESRTAVRSVLLALYEATSILAIPAALDKIIEKYDPTAKKIKESEEAAQKRALEESRRGRYPGPSVTSTMPARERVEVYGRGREFERYTTPSLEAPAKAGEKPSEALKPGDKGGAGAAGGEKKAAEATKKEGEEKRETDKTAQNYENQFIAGIEAFSDAATDLKDLEKHIKDTSPIDEEVSKAINAATEGVNTAIKAIKKMKSYLGRLNERQKREYKKAIHEAYKFAKKDIDALYTQLNSLSKESQVLGTLPMGTNPKHLEAVKLKYYAYFGKEGRGDFEAQLEAKKINLDAMKEDLEAKKEQISDAKKTAAQSQPPAPLPANIVKMEADTVKIKAQIKTVESDIKKLEGLLAQTGKVNLNDLRSKIQDLRKRVDEL